MYGHVYRFILKINMAGIYYKFMIIFKIYYKKYNFFKNYG